jgi:hypothetical protein
MYRALTNNPLVREWGGASDGIHIIWQEGSLLDLLTKARDLVHLGWRLLNHPLASSIKPNQTPYKTLVLAKEAALDLQSLRIIDGARAAAVALGSFPGGSQRVLADLQYIDWDLSKDILQQVARGESV